MRDSWLHLTPAQQQAVRDINPEWVPPRPALNKSLAPMRDNDSGEDFLYMHRQMIAELNEILARIGDPAYPHVEGWRRVPPLGDVDYPVPPFPESGLEEIKSVGYYEQVIAPQEERYTSPAYLRGVTLGQLGSDIEFNIHNDMHMRWAAPSPAGYRPPASITLYINENWDVPAYDYLGDTYSSHVNPIFWRLHGWIDNRIEDWKRANGVAREIEWKGTWIGPVARRVHRYQEMAEAAFGGEEMLRIDQIISESNAGDFDGFFRPRRHTGMWPRDL